MERTFIKNTSLVIILAAFSLTVVGAGNASAGVWHVDDSNTEATEDGTARWPFNTIGEAVAASADEDIINVAQGTYTETVAISSRTLYIRGGYLGAADYSSAGGDFEDANRDWENNVTTIDGEDTRRCVYFSSAGGEISGFTITRGSASHGGGIYCSSSSSPSITSNTITDNTAEYDGGGIYIDSCPAMTVQGNTFESNSAPRGGGLIMKSSQGTISGNRFDSNESISADYWAQGGGAAIVESDCQIIDNTFIGNTCDDEGGGLVFERSSGAVTGNTFEGNIAGEGGGGANVDDCPDGLQFEQNVFRDNVASEGGALAWWDTNGAIVNCTFERNRAEEGKGGGGAIGAGGDVLTMQGCSFTENHTGLIGGAISAWRGTFTISSCSFTSNTSDLYAGAIACGDDTEVEIIQNTFATNRAEFAGGAILCLFSGVLLDSQSNTYTSNTSAEGGAIYLMAGGSFDSTGDTFNGNTAEFGGAVGWRYAACNIQGALFEANEASAGGGAICGRSGGPYAITNSLFTGNVMGAFYFDGACEPDIRNCTIAGNSVTGVQAALGAVPNIVNCILWDNDDDLLGCAATYSCIEDGDLGEGNISSDPQFADPGNGDYHLKSQFGRWDPAANAGVGGWVNDAVNSPCIDAGDPDSDYTDEPMPNYARINMGAYGNTLEASKSGWSIPGEVTGDCKVDILDMLHIRNHLNEDVATDDNWKLDVTQDGKIDILDMLVVRDNLDAQCE